MNLRYLQKNFAKKQLNYRFTGHQTMAGENKQAIKMKSDITKFVDKYINSRDKYFYVYLTTEIKRMLSENDNVTYMKVCVENHVLYIKWQFKTSAQMLCIVVDLKDIKTNEAI